MAVNKSYINKVKQKLSDYYIKKVYVIYGSKLIDFLIVSMLLAFLIILVEFFFNFSSIIRTILVYSSILSFLFCLIGLFIIPFIKKKTSINFNSIAKEVGTKFIDIKDEMANVLQLVEDKSMNSSSNSLVEKAFEVLYKKIENLNFNLLINKNDYSDRLKRFLFVIVCLVGFVLFVNPLQNAFARIVNFDKEFVPPAKYIIEVIPGNAKIVRGNDFSISINVSGHSTDNVKLFVKSVDQAEYQSREIQGKDNKFKYDFVKVLSTFEYFITIENVKSEVYKVDVVNKPYISQFDIKITPPAYSKLSVVTQRDNGNISTLKGANVNIKLIASRELKQGFISFSDTTKVKLNVNNNFAEGNFRVTKTNSYKIVIQDISGNYNAEPITYTITALEDLYPEIEIVSPNKNINLPNDNKVALITKVKDDYGFSKLLLNYKLISSKFTPQEVLEKEEFKKISIELNKQQTEQDVYYIWDFTSIMPAVEDVYSYYFEIYDNDSFLGPKATKSAQFTVKIPGIDEVFNDAEKLQNEAEKKLVETLKEAEKLKSEIEKISNSLKQDKKEINWEEKEKIQEAVEKYNELNKKMEEAKEKLSETQNKLEEKKLLSEETLQKYMELQKLMNEMNSEEMQKAMEKMQQMMKNMNRDQVQNSFEDFKKNEDMFKKSIERTLNLLKRMKVEQKIDELEKRTKNLEKQQDELSKETEKSDLQNSKEKEELKNKQDAVSKDMKKLEEELKQLQETMKDMKDMPKEEADKAVDEMEKQENEELSDDAQQEMDKGDKNKAMQKQKQISKNMKSMNNMMQKMKSKMEMQNQMQVYSDMLKVINNILDLSKEQEKVKNSTSNLQFNSNKFQELTKKQSELSDDLDKINSQLSNLAQKTFAISPEMGKSLGEAKSNMNSAIQSMQGKNSFSASQNQTKAMGNLNQAATMMKNAMEQMMNQQGSGQGSGMMSMMQQFQKLSEQQMRLNQMTEQMMKGSGEMSMQQQAEMQRLANQQEMIKKSLEELNKEAKESGQSKKIASNMEKLLDEMNEVISNMRTQKDVDANIVKKQDKILSKLLDAQRSINDRDFEKERESNSGKNVSQKSPSDLIYTDDKLNKLKEELINSIKEGYSKDYEEIIRKYFEQLEKIKK